MELLSLFESTIVLTVIVSPFFTFFAAIWLTMNKVARSILAQLLPWGEAGRDIPMLSSLCCNFFFSKNSCGKGEPQKIYQINGNLLNRV